mgnify:CR=1 FL=1
MAHGAGQPLGTHASSGDGRVVQGRPGRLDQVVSREALGPWGPCRGRNQQELPEHLMFHTNIKAFDEDEETLSLDVLKSNIKEVLSNFNEKEVYIIERLFGLNGTESMCSEQIAMNLGVTKVNITFTKTRIIRMLRHSSLSNKILNGI